MDSIYRKTLHTLLGIAYGDAMGMPTEGCTRRFIREHFGTVNTYLPSPQEGSTIRRSFNAGQVTDDTQLTVFVCEALIRGRAHLNAESFAARLIEWLDTDPRSADVVGPSTLRAVRAIQGGSKLEEAGAQGTTNGAAMKIAPVGLICSCRDMTSLVEQVAHICMPTHNTRIAIQGAAAVATTVSYCFEHDRIEWDELLALIAAAADEAARFGAQTPSPELIARVRYAWRLAENADESEFLDGLSDFLGTGLETVETVPAALAIVRRSAASLKASVHIAANIGGDTDTIGAICGGICGACRYDITDAEERFLCDANDMDFDGLACRMAELVRETRGFE
ncbi:ADP-ribosylation/Crystallin J1 [Coriobacterium glomerans PW2]|uniref:ADP-ribosylation/Crystallin J1 n=1 Tax=Coriobacterium glomerans (strain ATCC 49209 / DSM 20642 / JCM 10262 / PW2) TaxID=700015 RepID=F2N8A7_CORGP|nr:ADP-ribosylglycohydrolase family protein [Coriobacterium glomerans]AEB07290.1 ADP-ribosylation/Crystallin J1 [Coriobacterium glomerans PW2]